MTLKNTDLQNRREQAVPRGVATLLPKFAARASNSEIWDVEGKRYIDFASGIAVLNTGHNHPKIIEAVKAQIDRFSHTCFQVMPYDGYIELAEKLNTLVPGDSPKQTLFLSTGAEAVENAIKIARVATGRSGVIAFGGGFHGRTMLGMALTGKVAPYKAGFGPFPAEIYHAPFPNAYLGISEDAALKALDQLFKADVEPSRVAAIIIEPVQGEGGFNVAPPTFLQALRKICNEHGILLIVDEIQTGFARTGKMFATEYAGIEPDLMTLAKSLAGGFPLSAVTGKAALMNAAQPGGLGGTYAGSPLACAAALAVLEVIQEDNLMARANEVGALLRGRLQEMAEDNQLTCIGEVRGLGAMVAVELVKDREAQRPDADLARAVVREAAEDGLILLSCGTRGNVIRFLCPLTISDKLLHEGMDILHQVLKRLV
ncbi:4-aminobutyrate--2-oxoglutarate transaminase [Luteithermobacter gelatinilyticus]|uniref:4-aminobutyrate--2-oxoglutarate transaminase n=1 Tax=Luteithermobacter gelatinilyticus TaxID=2582913 RepID=UPI0011074FA8|nr:4-aminobutyrate--2-oxoglutarate transaminase [Luteithermobacter gelatinilyticus]|tara:strand:- start:10669 stop:11955 length:1287 start_codon:yes stop_codon:yes gene_type:complete